LTKKKQTPPASFIPHVLSLTITTKNTMRNFINSTNEEICEFLLNNKKADGLELSAEQSEDENTGFKSRTVYKDKTMEIIYSYLEIDDDDFVENVYIYSKWWGQIKNSFFSCEGFTGKSKVTKCAVFDLNEIKPYKAKTSHPVNNKNEAAQIPVTDFDSLVKYFQRVYKKSPKYRVIEIISLPPNSQVKIEVIMPTGTIHVISGTSKKEAANKFADLYAREKGLIEL
jgi:hypothetical protein